MTKKKIAFLAWGAILLFVQLKAAKAEEPPEGLVPLPVSEASPNSVLEPESANLESMNWEFGSLGSEDVVITSEDWTFDEENPMDELVRSVLRASPNYFDGASFGLEGNYVVLKEENGNIKADGQIYRVRLMALRKEDGLYDRSLVFEVSAPGEDPFLVSLPEDIKGFESSFELRNFVSAYKSEILLSVKDVNNEIRRLLILDIQGKEGKVLFDSKSTDIPTIMGKFFDNFRAEIFVRETGARALIDLSPRKEAYEARLIYHKDVGTLRSPVRLWKNRHSLLQPVDVNGDGIYEMRGVIDLVGVGRSDYIAYVEFTLQYFDGAWRVLDTWIAPAEDLANLPFPRRID